MDWGWEFHLQDEKINQLLFMVQDKIILSNCRSVFHRDDNQVDPGNKEYRLVRPLSFYRNDDNSIHLKSVIQVHIKTISVHFFRQRGPPVTRAARGFGPQQVRRFEITAQISLNG
jgi:hypothetical protein